MRGCSLSPGDQSPTRLDTFTQTVFRLDFSLAVRPRTMHSRQRRNCGSGMAGRGRSLHMGYELPTVPAGGQNSKRREQSTMKKLSRDQVSIVTYRSAGHAIAYLKWALLLRKSYFWQT